MTSTVPTVSNHPAPEENVDANSETTIPTVSNHPSPEENADVGGETSEDDMSLSDLRARIKTRSQKRKAKQVSASSNNDVAASASNDSFPFPLGTWVAMSFPSGWFSGTIQDIFPGEDLCKVTFSDGDQADYDSKEIQEGVRCGKLLAPFPT